MDENLYETLHRLVTTHKNRLIVVDAQTKRPTGILSLSDLFAFLLGKGRHTVSSADIEDSDDDDATTDLMSRLSVQPTAQSAQQAQ